MKRPVPNSILPRTARGAGVWTVVSMLSAVALLQACTAPPPAPPSAPDPIARRIEEGLAKAAGLAEFTRGADRQAPPPAVTAATVTVAFHGEAAQLLGRIAAARGKELRIRGPKPHLPLVVQVNAVNVAYEEFLKDVGYQFGQRADLVLADGHIEIRYRGSPP